MNVIIGKRQQGKTSLLIRMSAEGHGTIVTATRQQVNYVKNLAKEMKMDIPEPISWNEFLQNHRGSHENYLIDEVGGVLRNLGIKAATIDDSDVKWMGS